MPSLKRFGIFFLLVLALTVIDFVYLGKPTKGIDDANIFFKYAQNFSHGHGFVFNAGGERVEGFTSLLWVLLCSLFFLISDQPEIWILIFLLVLTAAAITIVYNEVKKDIDRQDSFYFKKYFFWLYVAFILCIGPSFIAWSVLSLMENGVWNFLFASLVVLTLQLTRSDLTALKKIVFIITGILLVFTRPEAFAWILLFSILLFVIQKKKGRSVALPSIFFLSSVLASLALSYWRIQYFGYPLPNTYYAKVSDNLFYNISNGAKYALQFFSGYNPIVTLFFILLVAISFSKRRLLKTFDDFSRHPESFVLFNFFLVTLIIVCGVLLPFTTGGDHFGGFRFYQSILLLFAWGLPAVLWLYNENIREKSRRNWTTLTFIALLLFLLTSSNSLFNLKTSTRTQLNYEFYLAAHGRENAQEFNDIWETNPPSVGMVTVGGFGLRYKGETIDLMGLNNVLMGHNKGERIGIKNHAAFNKEIFYQLRPDILLPKRLAKPEDAFLSYAEHLNLFNFENMAMKNIFRDTAFQQLYQPVLIHKNDQARTFFAFANKQFLNAERRDSTVKLTLIKL